MSMRRMFGETTVTCTVKQQYCTTTSNSQGSHADPIEAEPVGRQRSRPLADAGCTAHATKSVRTGRCIPSCMRVYLAQAGMT